MQNDIRLPPKGCRISVRQSFFCAAPAPFFSPESLDIGGQIYIIIDK